MLEERIEAFRAGRRELERAVLLARDVDRRAAVLVPGLGARPPAPGRRLRGARGRRAAAARPDPQSRARPPRGRPAPDGTRPSTSGTSRGDGAILDGEGPAVPRRIGAPGHRRGGARRGWNGPRSRARALRIGELALADGVAVRARRRRLRPPHVPVRPVGLGQDLLARRDPRAAAGRDRAADRDPRPELGLRAPRAPAAGHRPAAAERYREAAAGVAVARRRGRRRAAAAASRRARHRHPGGAAAARSGRRPRGVRRAGGTARRGAAALARGADGRSTAPRRAGWRCACATSASSGSGIWAREQPGSVLDGARARRGRAAWSWTSARCHARGAGARGRGGPAPAVARPAAARAGADRDRRGAQRLPRASPRTP